MTDRVRTLVVCLEDDTRDDDAQEIIDAISLFRGVHHVALGAVITGNQRVARETAKMELRKELWDFLNPKLSRDPR